MDATSRDHPVRRETRSRELTGIPFHVEYRCAEFQADGVPCPDLSTDCEVCGRAHRIAEPVLRWRPHEG